MSRPFSPSLSTMLPSAVKIAKASASSSRWPCLAFFRHLAHAFRGAKFVHVHRQQPFGKQHLLGIEQLIELVGRLVPRPPRLRQTEAAEGQQQKEERQAQLQAQALGQFHASPSGITDAVHGADKVAAELAA